MTSQVRCGWMAPPQVAPFGLSPPPAVGPGDDDDDDDAPTPIGDPVEDDDWEDDDDEDDEEPLQVIAPQHRHASSIAAQWELRASTHGGLPRRPMSDSQCRIPDA